MRLSTRQTEVIPDKGAQKEGGEELQVENDPGKASALVSFPDTI